MSQESIAALFLEADENCDGRVADEEARNFFSRTGLTHDCLSAIWKRVKPPEACTQEKGLNRRQFSQALRLVAYAQQGFDVVRNKEMTLAAMDGEAWRALMDVPLKAPELKPPGEEPRHLAKQLQDSSVDDLSDDEEIIEPTITHLLRPSMGVELPPIPYEIRYPPLHSEKSATLRSLVSIHGSLFAYPSFNNGLLHWRSVETKIRRPDGNSDESLRRSLLMLSRTRHADNSAANEDADAAASSEILNVSYKGRSITSVYLDRARSILWVADRDGWISGHDVKTVGTRSFSGGETLIHQWQASRVGYITSMVVNSIGELWTGNNRGVLRIWSHTAGPPSAKGMRSSDQQSLKARELRKNVFDRAHNSSIISLQCAADGYIVWSASAKDVLLWDAGSGMCFGSIRNSSYAFQMIRPNFFSESSTVPVIDANEGMEVDPRSGAVLWRPSRDDYEYCYSQQESWAALSDRGVAEFTERLTEGAGKAVKMFGKIGGKLAGSGSSMHSTSSSKLDNESTADPGSVSGSFSRVTTMISTMHNTIWIAHDDGTVKVYTASGKFIHKTSLSSTVTYAAEIGSNVWIGTVRGDVMVLSSKDLKEVIKFKAHKSAIKSITQVGVRAFTLAGDGSISGWSIDMNKDMRQRCWCVCVIFNE